MDAEDKTEREVQSPLTNSWMNSPIYLAAMAHIGWATLLILSCSMFLHTHRWILLASFFLTLFAAIKEFWYDARYELPPQTTKDNVQDFLGYLGGIALAWLVIWLSHS
jgi:hypothetical protein